MFSPYICFSLIEPGPANYSCRPGSYSLARMARKWAQRGKSPESRAGYPIECFFARDRTGHLSDREFQKRRAGEVRESSSALRRGDVRTAFGQPNKGLGTGTHQLICQTVAGNRGSMHPPEIGPGRRPTLLPTRKHCTGRARKVWLAARVGRVRRNSLCGQ